MLLPAQDAVLVARRIERDQAAGIPPDPFTRRQRHRDDRAAAVKEGQPGAFQLLEDESLSSAEPGPEPLGKGDADVDVAQRTEERVLLTEKLLGAQLNRNDLAWIRPGKGHLARAPVGAEVGDEKALAAQELPLETAEEAT